LNIQGQHEKAVEYFRRALRLNANYLAAWTLMGHEYMEMKNTPAAIGEVCRMQILHAETQCLAPGPIRPDIFTINISIILQRHTEGLLI
jgi:hypothetical protein